jgi:hypothetical protein
MMKAITVCGFGLAPNSTAGFEKIESANDIGGDEVAGTGNRAIDMGFGGQVHDVGDGVALNDLEHGYFIADIDFLEGVFRMARDGIEIREVTGVGKAVEIDEVFDLRLSNDVVDDVRADEAGTAGN